MRKIICLSIIFLICSTLNGFSQFFPVDTAKLNTAYRALEKDRNSAQKQQRFLEAFPSTFDDFNMTYQYFESKEYDLTMYKKGSDHIMNGLALLNLLPDSVYFDKLIRLSLGGRFCPDAPSYLQHVLETIIKKKPASFFQRLSNFNEGQLISFWFFYFNSRFEKDYVADFEKFKKLKSEFPNVVNAMVIAYPAACGKVWY